ncbi:hypothetical protein QBC47DRAFT_366025 [Echria macrotheca]|uniref:Uncharacterized protein n=1 Tax=Echria macrotheca TaxID=438768 RepID=A0AAJ0B0T3_9PEZI|nr:hypothetical protein QBC47DRAFT_366025 [Echria macrotheca]
MAQSRDDNFVTDTHHAKQIQTFLIDTDPKTQRLISIIENDANHDRPRTTPSVKIPSIEDGGVPYRHLNASDPPKLNTEVVRRARDDMEPTARSPRRSLACQPDPAILEAQPVPPVQSLGAQSASSSPGPSALPEDVDNMDSDDSGPSTSLPDSYESQGDFDPPSPKLPCQVPQTPQQLPFLDDSLHIETNRGPRLEDENTQCPNMTATPSPDCIKADIVNGFRAQRMADPETNSNSCKIQTQVRPTLGLEPKLRRGLGLKPEARFELELKQIPDSNSN